MKTGTINYKEVFQLAESKGYFFKAGKPTNDGEYYDNDINEWEATLIQKWLRDTHKIAVYAIPRGHNGDNGEYFEWFAKVKTTDDEIRYYAEDDTSFELAMLEGIIKALQLI